MAEPGNSGPTEAPEQEGERFDSEGTIGDVPDDEQTKSAAIPVGREEQGGSPPGLPNQPDDPLEAVENDQLGRAAFAEYLARRIDAIPPSNSYAIHLDGPWGAGKSTVLNFLEQELEGNSESDDRWLVVRFNAWQHQHVEPPWWPLMDEVYRESKSELRWRNRAREYWWRFSAGRLPLIAGIVILTLLAAVALPPVLQTLPSDTPVLSYLATNAETISAVLALVGAVLAGTQVANKPVFLRSSAAAQSYVNFASNPMNEIRDRFTTLLDRIPVRVVVFVDDLDRCESAYVRELLEGIQTLFRGAPVVYVIAADRRWVTTCFEQEYKHHTSSVREPGKPLGTLFLEKHFQVSAPLPGISKEVKQRYWQELIQLQSGDESESSDEELSALLERISEMQTQEELRRVVEESGDRSFRDQRAIRGAAVNRIASTDIEKRSENRLQPFASLLEPNPRAMKRLVNAYNVHLALMLIAEVDIDHDHLALWTVLTLYWPQLAQYLGDNPEMVELVGQPKQRDTTDVSSEMKPLFTDPDVIDVVTGQPLAAELTSDVVEKCATIRA